MNTQYLTLQTYYINIITPLIKFVYFMDKAFTQSFVGDILLDSNHSVCEKHE